MPTAVPQNLFARLQEQISAYESQTGQRVSEGVLNDFLTASLSASYAQGLSEEQLATQKSEFQTNVDLEKQRIQQETSAAKAAGYTQIGSTAAQLGLTGASLYMGAKSAATTNALLAKVITPGGSAPAAAPVAGATAAGAPSVTAPLTGGEIATPLSGAAEAAPAAEGLGVGATAGVAAAGVAAEVGFGKAVQGSMGEAVQVISFLVNPVQATVDLVGSAIGVKTVICTELARQGLIDENLLRWEFAYRDKYIDNLTYAGYMSWAPWVVNKIQKHKSLAYLTLPLAKAYVLETSHRIKKDIPGSILGKLLLLIGVPFCRFLGRRAELWQILQNH